EIEHVGPVFRVFQQGAEPGNEDGSGGCDAEQIGNAKRAESPFDRKGDRTDADGLGQQYDVRPGDEGGKAPARPEEAPGPAAHDQPAVDPQRGEYDAPDRLGEVTLDEVLKAQEVVVGFGLPIGCLGLDGPGSDLAVVGGLRASGGGGNAVEARVLAQFRPEHAVVLREPAG